MAKEHKGGVIECVEMLLHHVAPNKAKLIDFVAQGDFEELSESFTLRNNLVRENAEQVLRQLKKLEILATKKGYTDILEILNEKVEFGHPSLSEVLEHFKQRYG